MSSKRTRKVRLAVLVKESSTQLVMYLLDTCARYSTYNNYTDFEVSERLHEGPEFSGNYLIDYIYHRFHHTLHYNYMYLITTEK